MYQQRYYAKYPFPTTLKAYEDVEVVLPIGRFGALEYTQMQERLSSVAPWGQTPLYLAIQHTLQQLQTMPQDPSMEHDIIVISDGRNYQFNPSPDKNLSADQVLELAHRLPVHFHVIGFGVPREEWNDAAAQFRRLADATQGSVTMQVADAVQLIENLRNVSQPGSFVAYLPNGEGIVGQCGTPIVLPSTLPENTPIRVDYRQQRKTIPVSARSAIRLFAGADEKLRPLESEQIATMARAPIVGPQGSATPFALSFAPPKMLGSNELRWTGALVRLDGEVAQRPKHLWLEITPLVDGQAMDSSVYVVQDGCWAVDQSTPILEFTTERWPAEAQQAMIRFWCSDQLPTLQTEWKFSLRAHLPNRW